MNLFGARAVALSGAAARILGWRPEDFWAATPAELASSLRDGGETTSRVSSEELTNLLLLFPDKVG
jgi:hypothetical protein